MDEQPNAPAQLITDTDKRGLVNVVTAILLSFVLVSLGTRLYIRLGISRLWRWDDTSVMMATVACITFTGLMFAAVQKQLGLTIDLVDQDNISPMQTILFVSDIFYIVVLGFTKCSAALLYLALNPSGQQKIVAWVICISTIVWAVASILIISINCGPHLWLQQCPGELARWGIVTAFDTVTELLLFVNAIHLVYGLQMRLKAKLTVISAFGMRLPIIAAALIRLHHVQKGTKSSDPTLAAANTEVWTAVELCYAVISCTLLCLGPFLTPFEKNYVQRSYRRPSYKLSASRSTELSKVGRSRGDDGTLGTAEEIGRGRGRGRGRAKSRGSGGAESQEAVLGGISKQVEWEQVVESTTELDRATPVEGSRSADVDHERNNSRDKILQKQWNSGW